MCHTARAHDTTNAYDASPQDPGRPSRRHTARAQDTAKSYDAHPRDARGHHAQLQERPLAYNQPDFLKNTRNPMEDTTIRSSANG